MPEKCKDCCSRLFCMSVAEVNGEDFETMANKKDCRKRVFTNADRIRAMIDEELADWLARTQIDNVAEALEIAKIPYEQEDGLKDKVKKECLEWLKQPAEEGNHA